MTTDIPEKVIDFMRWRFVAVAVSVLMVLASIGSLAVNGLSFGLDFTGGTLIEVHYSEAPELSEIRSLLVENSYEKAVVVNFGSDTDILVRLPGDIDDKSGASLVQVLNNASTSDVVLRRLEFVGPQVGEELREEGGLAMLIALCVVMFYVAVRFQFKFSVGAVVALAHDVTIVLGVFSLFKLDFDLTVLAAILAVIGYSLNDTIVVSDRIRENFRVIRDAGAIETINISLTETLGRTIITSLTTIFVLLALYFLGGETIHNFSLALLVGIFVGTYSSIYVAANALIFMKVKRDDLIVLAKDDDPELNRP